MQLYAVIAQLVVTYMVTDNRIVIAVIPRIVNTDRIIHRAVLAVIKLHDAVVTEVVAVVVSAINKHGVIVGHIVVVAPAPSDMRVLVDAAFANDMIVVYTYAALLVLTDAMAAIRTTACVLLSRSAVLILMTTMTMTKEKTNENK